MTGSLNSYIQPEPYQEPQEEFLGFSSPSPAPQAEGFGLLSPAPHEDGFGSSPVPQEEGAGLVSPSFEPQEEPQEDDAISAVSVVR